MKASVSSCILGTACSAVLTQVLMFPELDQRHATQCTLKTDSDCFISFSIVMGELGTSAHNLHIYGKEMEMDI